MNDKVKIIEGDIIPIHLWVHLLPNDEGFIESSPKTSHTVERLHSKAVVTYSHEKGWAIQEVDM